jgi:DNA-directed RNA polymerase
MSKARRVRKNYVFTSGGKFPVLTLCYITTALSQSAFRIHECYIIKINTKFANFAGLYFPHFTTFRGQTLQFY